MGFVSLQEDVEESLRLAKLVAERLPIGQVSAASADNIIKSVLKRCAYIEAAMSEIKKLHSDLSKDTRNRIYTLRSERDDGLKKIAELELNLKNLANSREMKKALAKDRVRIPKLPKESTKKARNRKPKLRVWRGSSFS